jgi:chromosomal replication initiation ATPase DnaA
VAEAFKVDLGAILGRSRKHGITRIRQIAMMLATRVCKTSRNQVGLRFFRDHSTVFWAETKFAPLLEGATSQIGGNDGR